MAGGVFISYRREDSRHAAGRLYQHLADKFGEERIFIDVDNIAPGADFTTAISDRVANCDALVALIGPSWLEVRDDKGVRRLDDPGDFVHVEIESALARGVRVIPVLVDSAPMPRAAELPAPLKEFAKRNAVRLEHGRFKADADQLVQTLVKDLHIPLASDAEIGSRGQLSAGALTGLLLLGSATGLLLAAGIGAGIIEVFNRSGRELGEVYADSPHIHELIGIIAVVGVLMFGACLLSLRLESRIWRALAASTLFAAGMLMFFAMTFHWFFLLLRTETGPGFAMVLSVLVAVVASVPLIRRIAR